MMRIRELVENDPQRGLVASKMRIELENALYELDMLKAKKGASILRKAINEIKAAHPELFKKE